MEISEHVDALRTHGTALAEAAAPLSLDTRVPTCPDWTVRDLLGHIGRTHRWAASFVTTGRTDPPIGDSELAPVPTDDELLDWYCEGHAALVSGLESAPFDLDCWSFLPAPSPLAFWARRQAHETAIHRADADSAGGSLPAFPVPFAIDGIDELLLGFFARKRGRLVADPPVTIGVRVLDGGPNDCWTITVTPEGRHVGRGGAHGDCVLAGRSSDLYLALWNRRDLDGITVTGDASAFDVWREKARITWS